MISKYFLLWLSIWIFFPVTKKSKNNACIMETPVRKSHVERQLWLFLTLINISYIYIIYKLYKYILYLEIFHIYIWKDGKTKTTSIPPRCAFASCCSFPRPFRGRESMFNRANQSVRKRMSAPLVFKKKMGFVPFPSHMKEGAPGGKKP